MRPPPDFPDPSSVDPGSVDPGRAWGWVAALRDGSTTPWSLLPADAGTAPPTARDLPGAQQLELARRINLAAARPGAADQVSSAARAGAARAALVERVLTASAIGRGVPDLELVGAAGARTWGPSPVDPEMLTDQHLLRVAVTVLAEDVVAADRVQVAPRSRLTSVSAVPRRARRHLRRHQRGHRLVGDPWLARTVREEMLRAARPLARPDATVVVLAPDLAALLAGAFTARSFDEGGPRWEHWLRSGVGDALPPRADLSAVARRWRDVVGRDRVVIVTALEQLPQVLGLPARCLPRLAAPHVSGDAVDLARRVSAPLGLLVAPDERRRLLRRVLLPMLQGDHEQHPGAALAVRGHQLDRVVRRAAQMRDDLRAAGYPVVGDLQSLVPAADASATSTTPTTPTKPAGAGPDDAGVLALAIRVLLAAPPQHRPERRDTA